MSFADRLKEARINKKMTQQQLADKINVGNTAISNYEKGTSFPNTDILYLIFDVLEVSPNFLFQDSVPIKENEFKVTDKYEQSLITNFRDLSDQGKEYILQTMDMAVMKYKKDNSVSENNKEIVS